MVPRTLSKYSLLGKKKQESKQASIVYIALFSDLIDVKGVDRDVILVAGNHSEFISNIYASLCGGLR